MLINAGAKIQYFFFIARRFPNFFSFSSFFFSLQILFSLGEKDVTTLNFFHSKLWNVRFKLWNIRFKLWNIRFRL